MKAWALREVCPALGTVQSFRWRRALTAAMRKHGITSERRAAKFIATVAHESGEMRFLEELWGPTAAQRGYEGRRDLGNLRAGDGYRFRGRGLIQVTGRANYAELSHGLGVDFVREPSLVSMPQWAAMSAAWWWREHGCNRLADIPGVPGLEAVTRRVNGGLNGWGSRLRYFERAVPVAKFLVP